MTSHWPTFSDGLFWCACDNRTFDTEEAWLLHVVRSVIEDHRALTSRLAAIPDDIFDQPSESSSGHAAPSR